MELTHETFPRPESIQVALVHDYIATISEIELEKPADAAHDIIKDTPAYRIGALVAQSFIRLANNSAQGYAGLIHAKRELEPHVSGATPAPINVMLDAALDITLSNYDPASHRADTALLARQSMQLRATQILSDQLIAFRMAANEAEAYTTTGSIVELTTLGILNRQSNSLAMPALPHHDQGTLRGRTGNDNIDFTITSQAPNNAVHTRRAQVKAACLRFHDNNFPLSMLSPERRTAVIEKRQRAAQYERNGILVLSGCCDLNLRFNESSLSLDTADMLVNEALGRASQDEMDKLDNITAHVQSLLGTSRRIFEIEN